MSEAACCLLKMENNINIITDNIEHIFLSRFTSQRVVTHKNLLHIQIAWRYKCSHWKKRRCNTTRNNTTEVHQYMPDKIIGQFTTSNKTSSKGDSDQYWRSRASGHSKIERSFISALSKYTAIVPKMIRNRTIDLGHILPLCFFKLKFPYQGYQNSSIRPQK